MGRPTLDHYNENFNPISSADYMVIISDNLDIGPLVSDIEIPANNTSKVRYEIMGKAKVVPGRNVWDSNELPITFLLDRNTNTYQKLLSLHDSFTESKSGNIVGKPFTVQVISYDVAGAEVMAFKFTECWLSNLGSLSFASTNEAQLLNCQCTIVFSDMEVKFTSMSRNGNVSDARNHINSRINDGYMIAGNRGPHGFSGMDISRQLEGNNPMNVVKEVRQNLAASLGFSLSDLNNMQNMIASARNVISNTQSKVTSLSNAIKQKNIQGAVRSLSRLPSIF